ncbi:MAG: tetratricopeptide repeat protein [Blastocatellia bacterium]|nr:tetratricopeptide repeat protein [Blastocatellia bacterium]
MRTCLAVLLCAAQQQTASYEQALSLIRQQQIEQGIAVLRKLLEQSPDDIKAHNLLGIALTNAGKIEEADAHFQKAIELNPRFYPALKNLAINEIRLDRSESARTHLEQALQIEPNDPVIHLALGEIHFQAKRFPEAASHFDRSRDLPFKEPRTLLNYATSCLEAHQPEKAIELLGKLPAEADAVSRFDAGMIFARLGKYENAAAQFELARKGYPDPREVAYNLTLAYVKSRNYTAAIRIAQEILSQWQEGEFSNLKSQISNLLAQAYEGNGQTVEAYNALRKATQLDPRDENNYLDLATLCVDHANYDLGLEIVNIGIRNIPRSGRLYFQRGTLLAMKGQTAAAGADFENASRLSPQENLPYVARGLVLLELGQTAAAVEILRRRAAASPNDYLVLYILGEALDRSDRAAGSGEEKEAIQALEKSVMLNPDFAASRVVLGKLLLRRGEVDRAVQILEKARELDPDETSALYQLALAYRKKGDAERAKELFAKVDQARSESREQFTKRTLLRLVRGGSQ